MHYGRQSLQRLPGGGQRTRHDSKSKPYGYPEEIITLGDRLRAKRMDKGLLQKDVADIIGTCVDTVLNWEKGKTTPAVVYLKNIDDFLSGP